MKKIILSIFYPLWFFLAKTYIGCLMMIPISLSPIPILMTIIFPSLMNSTGSEAEAFGIGVAILSLLCSPLTAGGFMFLGFYLEERYKNWNYKIEMGLKMF